MFGSEAILKQLGMVTSQANPAIRYRLSPSGFRETDGRPVRVVSR